jgi:uncharacterized membrane protein
LFGFLNRKKKFFTDAENHVIVEAIRHAEKDTSGEVRVFAESRCRWMDAIDRAAEMFYVLEMQKTDQRNGVLVYVALKDRQLAVFADEGIHKKVGEAYWEKVVNDMLQNFNRNDYAKGIAGCVIQVGEALRSHFPYDRGTDKNELPDDIVLGR